MMKEISIHIKTPDKKVIDGILRGPIHGPLIIIVHGLCGHMNEALHYNAARFFDMQGYSSFRFGLYSWNRKNRKFHECTLATHGKDIRTVVNFLRKKGARHMSAVGHSYGFPSILMSDIRNFDAIVSWDGSCLPHSWFKKLVRIQKPVKGRIVDEGYWTIMGEGMSKEAEAVDSLKIIKKLQTPMMFVTVEKGHGDSSSAQKMFKAAPGPKEYTVIKGADHNFTPEGKQEILYKTTIEWVRRYTQS